MLLHRLPLALPQQTDIILPPGTLPELKQAIQDNSPVYIFPPAEYYLEIHPESWSRLPDSSISLTPRDTQYHPIKPWLTDILMGRQNKLSYSREFMDSFQRWRSFEQLPPLELTVTQDKSGLHLQLYDCLLPQRLHFDCPDSTLSPLLSETDKYVALIDEAFQNQHWEEINQSIKSVSSILKKITAELPLQTLKQTPYRIIRIFQQSSTPFIPWEFLFPDNTLEFPVVVSPHLPVEPPGLPIHFTSIYEPRLSHTAREAGSIIESMLDYWEVESYSDVHYDDYKAHICDTDILHFAGHGRELYKKGQIQLDKKWYQSLLFSSTLSLACFNACYCGRYPEGLIQQTLEQGARLVLASPYALPDRDWIDFSRFYHHFQAEHARSSISFFSLLDKRIRLFYRKYIPYQFKI